MRGVVCLWGVGALELLALGLLGCLIDRWGLGYLAECRVVGRKLFVTYMYFVLVYVYDYDDWSSYLGCGLLT